MGRGHAGYFAYGPEDRVTVFVRFSDNSRQHEGTYLFKDKVNDIIADIMVDTKILRIYDHETGLTIHEDTELATLQNENRLDQLEAEVSDEAVKCDHSRGGLAKGPIGKSASRLERDVEKIGRSNPAGPICSIDDHAGTSTGNISVNVFVDATKTAGVENHGQMTSHKESCFEAIYSGEKGGAAISSHVMGKLTEKNRNQLTILASPEGGSRDVIRRAVGPSGRMTQDNEGGTNMEGNIPPDVMKHAIDAQADVKKHAMAMAASTAVEVCVRFSDYSRKFERAYRPKDKVHDIISDIMENKRISHICDSETGEKIDENIKLSTLQKEDRLDRLKAIVVQQ